jgi:acetyltransferase-like isoleucine patch superfamily enzyme
MTQHYPNTKLGKDPIIGEYVLLGLMPQGKVRHKSKVPLPDLVIGDNPVIRSHSVIYAGNMIGNDFQTGHGIMIRERNRIGNNVSIGTHSIVERDNIIGDDVRIHSNCFIPEFIEIRKGAWIGPNVTVLNVLHPPCPSFEQCAKGMIIHENAKIGGNVTIGPRVEIGANSIIGSGAVITKSIPPDSVAYGNPARVHKKIEDLSCILDLYKRPYEWEVEKDGD